MSLLADVWIHKSMRHSPRIIILSEIRKIWKESPPLGWSQWSLSLNLEMSAPSHMLHHLCTQILPHDVVGPNRLRTSVGYFTRLVGYLPYGGVRLLWDKNIINKEICFKSKHGNHIKSENWHKLVTEIVSWKLSEKLTIETEAEKSAKVFSYNGPAYVKIWQHARGRVGLSPQQAIWLLWAWVANPGISSTHAGGGWPLLSIGCDHMNASEECWNWMWYKDTISGNTHKRVIQSQFM